MKLLQIFLSASALSLSAAAIAADRNDIPSCYDYSGVPLSAADDVTGRELTIAVDGTFAPDVNLKRSVHSKVHHFLQPGDRVTVVGFSAYVQDNYTDIAFTGRLDTLIADRDDVSKKKLKKFDLCMGKQQNFVKKNVDQAIKASFKPEGGDVPKTELLTNLSQLLAPVVSAQAGADESRRLVLLVSDMLENSDVTSFYLSGGVRKIDPKSEISKVTQAGMVADFGSAEVYVIGAGWVAKDVRGSYRGGKVMMPLKEFWVDYFAASNAELKGFGQPALMQEL